MRKTILIPLLFCVFTGGVSAQLTFNGEVYAGFLLEKEHDKDETLGTYARKDGRLGAPLEFNLGASVGRRNYGAKMDISFLTTDFRLNDLYGWVGFLENSIRLSMGQFNKGVLWVSNLDPEKKILLDTMTGFRVEYNTPLDGLNVGMAFPARDYDLEKFFKKIMFGAHYVHPLFNTLVAYDMGNNGRFLFNFNFTGILDLTDAGIEVFVKNLATWDDPFVGGELEMRQKVGYRVLRPLTVSLTAEQIFYGSRELAEEDKELTLTFTPELRYRILPTLSCSLRLDIGSSDKFETVDMLLKPSVEYALGPALFYAQYELEMKDMKEPTHRFGFGIEIKAF